MRVLNSAPEQSDTKKKLELSQDGWKGAENQGEITILPGTRDMSYKWRDSYC